MPTFVLTVSCPDRKGIVALVRPEDGNLVLVGEGGVQRVEIAP